MIRLTKVPTDRTCSRLICPCRSSRIAKELVATHLRGGNPNPAGDPIAPTALDPLLQLIAAKQPAYRCGSVAGGDQRAPPVSDIPLIISCTPRGRWPRGQNGATPMRHDRPRRIAGLDEASSRSTTTRGCASRDKTLDATAQAVLTVIVAASPSLSGDVRLIGDPWPGADALA